MKYFVLIASILLCSLDLYSQVEVSGKVTDEQTGRSLPGTSINIEGTTVGVITDVNGMFSITVPDEDAVLYISFVGYKARSITVGSQRTINVALEVDATQLEEVVVTALGIKREKKVLGYSVQDLQGDEVAETNPNNVVSALSGKIAGAQILTSSGQVGASSTIQIRGNKSFNSNRQPLFVVDGTPVMNGISSAGSIETYTDFGNAAMDIDPSNIESISILKGASASALYGSRAANGVVLITTKKGGGRKGIGVELNTSAAWDEVYILPNYQNEYGQGRNGSEYEWKTNYADLSYQEFHDAREFRWATDGSGNRLDWDESWGSRLDVGLVVPQFDSPLDENGQPIPTPWVSMPDNVKDFYETGFTQQHNLALTANGESASGRMTLGYTDQKGTSPNTDQTKINLGLNSHFELSKKLSFDMNVNYIRLNNDNLPQQGNSMRNPLLEFNSWYGRQVNTQSLYDTYEDIIIYEGTEMAYNWMMGYSDQHPNPYWNAYKNLMSRNRNRMYGNASVTYEIIDGLNLMGRLGTDFFNEHRRFIFHKYSRDWTDMYKNATNGNLWEQYRMESETNADLMLTFDRNLGENLSLFATLGGNYRLAYDQYATTSGKNLVVADFFSTSNYDGEPSVSFTRYKKVTNSVFASADLGFKNYLFLDLTLRGDWSSTLPEQNWNYWYPSANLGFIFTDAFGIDSNIFPYGKLRIGYAQVGDDTSPYQLASEYSSIGESTFSGVRLFGTDAVLPTFDLKPQLTSSLEFGGEFKFFQNRLGIDITYYDATTKNQILNVDIPYSSGYAGWMMNTGSIRNKGVELQVYGSIIRSTSGFNWDINVNWSTNNNEIVELQENLSELRISYLYSLYDVSLMAFPGDQWGAIYGYTMERNENGDVLIGSNGRPIETETPQILGYVNPDWIGGIGNTLSFKGVSLYALLDFRKGGDVYSMTKSVGQKAGILQSTVEGGVRENGMVVEGVYDEGVMMDLNGDGTDEDVSGLPNETVVAARDFWRNSRNFAELGVVDGSYIKLREVSLAYRLPAGLVNTIGLQNVTISLFGRNLALLYTHETNDVHIDPEVAAGGTVGGIGLESYQLPPSRTLGIKLNVNF